MEIIKRNGTTTEFDLSKIESAIFKAMKYGTGTVDEMAINNISTTIQKLVKCRVIKSVKEIETEVYFQLCKHNLFEVAKAYEGYRALAEFKRQCNTSDNSILGLMNGTNNVLINENSNKNAKIAPTQRDLVAGEVSKDISRRKLLPTRIIQAHDNGILHYHDMDYAMQNIFNCCLVNIGDMLDKGTVINGKMIESPNSFQVACTVMTQIMAQISSGQYGGQSMNVKHLGKYLRKTYTKAYDKYENMGFDMFVSAKLAQERMMEDLKSGVQTIQYQINTLMTTNGLL